VSYFESEIQTWYTGHIVKRLIRILMGISLALILAGIGMDYFGSRYAADRTSVRVLTGWGETDWYTSVWNNRASIVINLGIAVGLLPIIISILFPTVINLIKRLYPR
jgi:hypothetical protein